MEYYKLVFELDGFEMHYIMVRCMFRYVRFANKCYMIPAFINMSSTKVNFELNYVNLNRSPFF